MVGDNETVLPAERLARQAHAGQVDRNGQPYVDHLARVVAILRRRFPDAAPAEIEAAWLHDVLEDTAVTRADLHAAGISADAVEIVELLTKPAQAVYLEWIGSLAATATGHQGAVRVKLADNEDNASPARIRTPADRERTQRRYLPARAILLEALRQPSRC